MGEVVIEGRGITVEAEGNESFHPVVFVHGAGCSAYVWRRQMEFFRRQFRVVAVNLTGHGSSGAAAVGDARERYAGDVLAAMEFLGLRGATLVGHSMGGAIAIHIALNQPEVVDSLVLAGTGARLRVAPAIFGMMARDFAGAAVSMARFCLGAGAGKALVEELGRAIAGTGVEATVRDFRMCDGFDEMERVEKIAHPTLIVAGEADVLTPVKYSRYLKEKIRNSQLTVLPGCGHMMMMEDPLNFNVAVYGFLHRVSGC
ncbi:MAG: alpha/beta hydrolase [bacterium]